MEKHPHNTIKKSGIVLTFLFIVCYSFSAFSADKLAPATTGPGGLDSAQIPLLISLGFDDNQYADGVDWVVGTLFKDRYNNAGKGNKTTFDGTPMRASFYVISNAEQKDAWRCAYDAGFEVGNHTVSHEHNLSDLSYDQNITEIGLCSKYLVNEVGMPPVHIYGFRTPYLAFHPSNYSCKATKDVGLMYDCTHDDGTQGSPLQWAASYFPGTMENGWIWYTTLANTGLWEVPNCIFITSAGGNPSIKGFDSGCWPSGTSAETFLNYLKWTVDWHYKTSRAPMDIGLHSDYYSTANTSTSSFSTTVAQRRQALVDFLNWVQSSLPDARIVAKIDIVCWMARPVALDDLSQNNLFSMSESNSSGNILGNVTVATGSVSSGSSLTASRSGSTVSATGTVNMTGKLVAERVADMDINVSTSLKGADGIKITYTSNVPLHVSLAQSDLESKKASHFIGVPAAATSNTIKIPLNDYTFRKPYYIDDATSTIAFDLSKVNKVVVSPMALDVSKSFSFTITDLTFYGIGGVTKTVAAEHLIHRNGIISLATGLVQFSVARPGTYSVDILAANGRHISSIHSVISCAGLSSVTFAERLSHGLYLVRLSGHGESALHKAILK